MRFYLDLLIGCVLAVVGLFAALMVILFLASYVHVDGWQPYFIAGCLTFMTLALGVKYAEWREERRQ